MLKRIKSKMRALRARRQHESVLPEDNPKTLKNMNSYWTEERIERAVRNLDELDVAENNFYHLALTAAPELQRYNKVLDFGAGPGEVTYYLASKYPEMDIVAYDLAYRANNSFYQELTKREDGFKITFTKDYIDILDSVDLVFSNLVFSHFTPQAVWHYLSLFKKKQCDIICSARTDLPQTKGGRLSRHGSGSLYCHNYYRYLLECGYEVKWIYTMDKIASDKRCIYVHAVS